MVFLSYNKYIKSKQRRYKMTTNGKMDCVKAFEELILEAKNEGGASNEKIKDYEAILDNLKKLKKN